MPREKKISRRAAAVAAALVVGGEDDETASVSSDQTDSTAQLTDDEGVSELEAYEQKVREAMDLALEKSVHTRTNALTSLTTAFQKRVLTPFLLDHHQTICDLVERSLRKGRGPEQVAAARLASLLVLSLSQVPEAEQVYKTLQPVLTVALTDPSGPLAGRQECAFTLALSAFLACHDLADVTSAMNTLHSVFGGSLPKGNGELPNHPPAVTALHTAALNGFCLLLCLLSPTSVYSMANKLLREMFDLLGCSDVDLRIQAGEAVALLYEAARSHNDDYYWNRGGELCSVLKDLATDSHKFRAKKDRKQQRASFRDVVRTVEEEEVPCETVSLGPQHQRQELLLDTWSLKLQYSSLCRALAQGLSIHFTFNIGVRDMFNLGPPPLQLDRNMAALARRNQKKPNHESPASKARQMARNKNRDNRAAAKTYDD
ncbi:interferon-related developmental regulator 1-like [Homarus americanus]|uniref:interferon-related developmental regulator 1-like n=1 Tax=Homarus americanus TaxID=6706 RepID=UPI001C43E70A|nr:interferon-related developmental regulator 1-like [Homarus americanus]